MPTSKGCRVVVKQIANVMNNRSLSLGVAECYWWMVSGFNTGDWILLDVFIRGLNNGYLFSEFVDTSRMGRVTDLTYSKASIQRVLNKCFRIDLAESLCGSLGKMQRSAVKAG